MEKRIIEWTDEQVKNFWDYESQFPEKYFTYTYGERIIDEISPHLHGKKTVLDYGTGIGLLIPHLIKNNFEVTGTDFSHDSIELVNSQFKNEKKFKGVYYIDDIMSIEEKYDVIFCIEMIEHVNDHYLDLTFQNFKKLLSEDGIIVITTPNDENLDENKVLCPGCHSVFHRWQHVKSWNTSSLEKAITNFGFKKEKIFTTFFHKATKVEKKSFLASMAAFVRKYVLQRKEVKSDISSIKAPHLVAIIKR